VLEQHFSSQMAFLRDLTNYGSNLVIRSFGSSPKKMADIVLCGVLLKQIVAMLDAAEELLSAGCCHAAFLPARAAFEASIYADWIMISDSERRATRFVVRNYRDERLWANRAIPDTDQAKAFRELTAGLGVDVNANRPTLSSEATALLDEVNRILAQPELAVIDAEFNEARQKRKRDVEWYQLDGLGSIRDVARAVGRLPEYELFYSKGSQIAHTGSYKDHVRFSNEHLKLLPVRHLKDVNDLLNILGSVGIGTFRKFLDRYRPDEVPAYIQKYRDDWRDPYLGAPQLKSEW
jgi:hypothetical protein